MSLQSTALALLLSEPSAKSACSDQSGPELPAGVRRLTEEDLAALGTKGAVGAQVPVVQQLKLRHHQVARLLAEGNRPGKVAVMTGYSPSKISTLQQDPAFQELVHYYKEAVDQTYLEAHSRLAILGLSAVEELQERLDDQPKSFPTKDLLAVAELALDRSVAPSKSAGRGGSAPGGPSAPVAISISFVQPQPKPELIIDGGTE